MATFKKPQNKEDGAEGRGSALAVQAVDRVLRMLQAFDVDQRELGVSDSRRRMLGVHKSTGLAAGQYARWQGIPGAGSEHGGGFALDWKLAG